MALTAVVLSMLVGCGGTAGDAPATDPGGDDDSFPVTVGTLTVPSRPERIVVLGPTLTEMLFAIGAGDQVKAVDDNSDYPPDAPRTALSGFQPNAEAIAAQNPDLVVLSNDLNKVVDQLDQLQIPVYYAPAATTLDDTYRQMNELGRLTGHGDEAGAAAQRMKDEIDKLIRDVPTPNEKITYYYELDQNLYSVTSRTFVGSILARMGLVNVADPADADNVKGGYPQLSAEFVIQADPDLIFLADTKCCGQTPSTVKARPGWESITAVRQDRIVPLNDDIASRWGPRVVDLVRAVADAVHKATG